MAEIDDLISFEMFKNAIFSIADEMAVTICRTTYSGILRDNMDFATAIANAEGRLVAQGLTLPFHLGAMHTAIAAVMARYGDDIGAGDVFILNDPFAGGMHLPDIFIIKPVFADGTRIAFVLTTAHHGDVGGRVPGSNAADSTEIYQEGLRLPPLKLIEGGARNDTLWTVIETNVRLPVRLFGDLRAQLAACEVAEKQFLEQVARDGFPEDYPDADVLVQLSKCRLKLVEVPVKMHPRLGGVSMHRGTRAAFYGYKMFMSLALLRVRRRSPYRSAP